MGYAARSNRFNQWTQEAQVDRNKVYDRFGREIREHDIVWVPGHDLPFRVSSVSPDLSPQAPAPNIQQVGLVAVMPIGVVGGRPINELVRVRAREEYLTPEQLEQFTQMQAQAAAATEQVIAQELPQAPAVDAAVDAPTSTLTDQ